MMICECCGQKIRNTAKNSLSNGLVDTFIKFSKRLKEKGINKIHLQKDAGLTINQYNNFQKLQYFGVVSKVREDGKSTGYWKITQKGVDFLTGEGKCHKWVIASTEKGILEQSEQLVNIKNYPKLYEEYYQKNF